MMMMFLRHYRMARTKKHGAGRTSIKHAVMLGIMGQWIASGCRPRGLLYRLLPVVRSKGES